MIVRTRMMKIAGLIFVSYLSGILSGNILYEIFANVEEIFYIGIIIGFFVPIICVIANYIFKKS